MTSPMKAFRSTAAVASMHNPFFGTTLQHTRGCYLGRQRVTGRPAYWSPALLKERGLIRNTLVGVFVPQGGGKSTLAKSLVLRASALQSGIGQDGMPLRTRVQVNDHDTKSADGRGEYALVADHLMTPSVRLADIGSVNVFPMGMGLTPQDIAQHAQDIQCEVKGGLLDPFEVVATLVAAWKMASLRDENAISQFIFERILRSLTRQDVEHYQREIDVAIRSGSDEEKMDLLARQEFNDLILRPTNLLDSASIEMLQAAGLRCSGYWHDLIRGGRYGQVFNGTKSIASIFEDEYVFLDWVGVPSAAAAMLEGLIMNWMMTSHRSGRFSILPNLRINEEEPDTLGNYVLARARDGMVRKARKWPTDMYSLAQNADDYQNLGGKGSALNALGRSIDSAFGICMFGCQPPEDDVIHRITQRGISDADAWALTGLRTGEWGIHIPGLPMDFVAHTLLPTEKKLVASDQATRQRTASTPVSSIPSVQARLDRLVELQSSADPYVIGVET
ncbi:MAG: hypothetical protein WAT17_00265 [Candidatus Saccharimonadales bacterium]